MRITTAMMLDLLAPFKLGDDATLPGKLAGIFMDPVSTRLLFVWSTLPVRMVAPRRRPPEGEWERLDWLWHHSQWDNEELARRAGCLPAEAEAKRQILAAMLLVYPDGTINTRAANLLSRMMLTKLKLAPKAPAAPRTPPQTNPT